MSGFLSEFVAVVGPDGMLVEVAPAAAIVLGRRANEAIGRQATDLVAEADRSKLQCAIARGRGRERVRPPGEGCGWLSVDVHTGDETDGVVLVVRDVSELVEAERRSAEAEARYRALTEDLPDVVFSADAHGVLTHLNPSFERQTGIAVSDALGLHVVDLVQPDERPRVQVLLDALLRGEDAVMLFEGRYYSVILARLGWFEVRARLTRDDEGFVTGMLGVIRDVTDRNEAEGQLAYRARHDGLTGLLNRSAVIDHLGAALSAPSSRQVAVLFLDLDGFKQVNDCHGHEVGDALLADVGTRLQGALGPGEIAGRVGGDEFVVVSEGHASLTDALGVAERLHAALAGNEHGVSASIGVAVAESGAGTSVSALLRAADESMYRVKSKRAPHPVAARQLRRVERRSSARKPQDGACSTAGHARSLQRWFMRIRALLVSGAVLVAGALVAPPVTAGNRAARSLVRTPLVIGHRGASGYRPEHTLASYELAIAMGADFVEPDLVSTSDGVLVARHENEISGTTDVAAHPEFADRQTTKTIDGVALTGWFTEDFTLAELKTLRAKERIPTNRPANTRFDGQFEIPTLEEVLDLVAEVNATRRRDRHVGVYPETKHPTYFDSIGLSLEEPLVATLEANGYDSARDPVFIQSFETANLRELAEVTPVRIVQLFGGSGAPFDLVAAGDPRTYADLATPDGLAGIAEYADGIGPAKNLVIPVLPDGTLGEPTALVGDAHRERLLVHIYTMRNENPFVPPALRVGTDPAQRGDVEREYAAYWGAGIDGVFSDNPDTAVGTRAAFLAGR